MLILEVNKRKGVSSVKKFDDTKLKLSLVSNTNLSYALIETDLQLILQNRI